MSFRPNPFHAKYFLNVYNMSFMYLNKILFKPIQLSKENMTNIYPEMKTDLRLVGIVVNLVKNGNADEKVPIIKC